ncbi:MAG: transposase [Rhizobium sp.]|nr:transposase [Rhizobium sp.]
MARGDLGDADWQKLKPLLPKERGRKCRPSQDNRRFLNGMLHVLRAGCPWRDMHPRYGKWISVYVRCRRWAEQGVWDALLEALVRLGLTDDWQNLDDNYTRSKPAAANRGLTRRVLIHHAASLRQKSPPEKTIRETLFELS